MARERRGRSRINVMFGATLEGEDVSRFVRLVDLSEKGCGLVGDLEGLRSGVTLRRRGLTVHSRLAWVASTRAGVRFERPVDIGRMISRIGAARAAHPSSCRRPALRTSNPSPAEQRSAEWCAWILGIGLLPREAVVAGRFQPRHETFESPVSSDQGEGM